MSFFLSIIYILDARIDGVLELMKQLAPDRHPRIIALNIVEAGILSLHKFAVRHKVDAEFYNMISKTHNLAETQFRHNRN